MAPTEADVSIEVDFNINMADLQSRLKVVTAQLKTAAAHSTQLSSAYIRGLAKEKLLIQDRIHGMEKHGKALKQSTSNAYYWAMGVMYAGMTMQRMFTSMWQYGSKVFQDVKHTVWNTVTGFDLLNGSVQYLGFTIGQALEPIAAWLAPIIMDVALWVSEHEELVRNILIGIAVVAAFLLTIGGLTLQVKSVIAMFTTWGGWLTKTYTGLGLLSVPISAIIVWIAAVIAIVLVLKIMWDNNFGQMKDFVITTFDIIWKTFKALWKNIQGTFEGLMKVLKGLFTGDFSLIMEGMKQIFYNVIAFMLKLVFGFAAMVSNVFIWIINMVIAGFFNMVTLSIGYVKSLVEGLNKILPRKWEIDTSGFDKVLNKVNAIKDSVSLSYLTGDNVAGLFGGIDKILGVDKLSSKQSSVDNSVTYNNITIEKADGDTTADLANKIIERLKQTTSARQ